MEEIGAADMAMAVSLSVHILSQYPVVTWGTDEQQVALAAGDAAGEALGAFALTEPHAGSDAARDPDAGRAGRRRPTRAYRLTGTKIWISNAPEADRYLVFATVDPDAGTKGITAFLVEKGMPGFRFGAHEQKMGIRACPAAELVFEGCEVPAANRLGDEGEGYRIALSALGEGRISIAAACVGLARAGLEAAARYLGERKAFGGAARRPAGPAVHARRDGPRRGGGAGADPGGARGQGSRREPRRGVVAGQVDRVGHRDARRDRRRPAVRRRVATRARPASSG